MRDPKRIDEICRRLAAAWKTCPDLRLGQIIENVKLANKIDEKGDLFYIEDYQMIGMIEDHMYGFAEKADQFGYSCPTIGDKIPPRYPYRTSLMYATNRNKR